MAKIAMGRRSMHPDKHARRPKLHTWRKTDAERREEPSMGKQQQKKADRHGQIQLLCKGAGRKASMEWSNRLSRRR